MRKIYTLYGKLLSLCLILLGFGACDNGDDIVIMRPAEYGTPNAKYRISGKVVANDQEGIREIKVSLTQYNGPDNPLTPVLPPVFTNGNGQFLIEGPAFPRNTFVLQVEDVDGTLNGSFTYHAQEIVFADSDYSNGDNKWYQGEASKDLGTIKLNPVEEE